MLGRDCSDMFLLIKFGMKSNATEMANSLTDILNNLKGLAGEMAPDLFELIQSINISCKTDDTFVYIIIEVEELFFQDCAKFFN